MSDRDRLFRVIVLGGIGMIGVAADGCGGSTTTGAPSTDGGADAVFPSEGPAPLRDAATSFDATNQADVFFPTEGPPPSYFDSGHDANDGSVADAIEEPDAHFPTEGPPPLDQ